MSAPPQLRVEVLMEGFLSKRSPRQVLQLSIEQRRYFILTLSLSSQQVVHCHLSYFRSGDERIPLGSIPLSSVTRVAASDAASGRFDIATSSDSRVYSLRCDNAADYSRWMQALKQAKEEEGSTRPQHRTQQPQQQSVPPSTPSLHPQQRQPAYEQSRHSFSETDSSSRSTGSAEGAEAMALMLAGCNVTLVTPPPPSSPASPTLFTPAVLQYREDDTALGSLYSTPLQSSQSCCSACRLSLHQLSDIFLGRQSRAWLSSASSSSPPAPDCCFSACTRLGVSLHVIGERRDVVNIVYGINSLMLSRGQRRVRAKARQEQQQQHPAGGSSSTVVIRSASSPQHGAVPSSPSSSTSSLTRFSSIAPHPAPAAFSRVGYSAEASTPPPPLRAGRDREMEDWLAGLGGAFSAYCDLFADNGVDLAFLATLSAAELQELGVSRLHAKKIMHARSAAQPHCQLDSPAQRQRSAAEPSRLNSVRASVAAAEAAFSAASTATSTPSSAAVSSSAFSSALRSEQSAARHRAEPCVQKSDGSSLLAALPSSSCSASAFVPPAPTPPQETRRDTDAAFHSARFGTEVKRASLEPEFATAGRNSVKERSSGRTAGAAKTYLGGVFSALKAGGGSRSSGDHRRD